MAERNVGRPWNEEEDKLLKEAISTYGEHDNWKKIALSIPGRTNKACRKRWLHSLSPNVKKSAWTADEDQLLLTLYDQYGSKWSTIARYISGRTDDACSKRYREALDPTLKKDEWTPEEDAKLVEAFSRIGGKWGRVGQELQRSGLGCRNRWRLLERKKATRAAQSQEASSSQHSTLNRQDTEVSEVHQSTPQSSSEPLQIEIQSIDTVPVESHWPPYYPPESYPLLSENLCLDSAFRELTPEKIIAVSPHVAPFQFSSSSLSAALSDPPQLPLPLPPVSTHPEPRCESEPLPCLPSLSPLSQQPLLLQNGVFETNEAFLMSLDDLPDSSEEQHSLEQIYPTFGFSHSQYFQNNLMTTIRDTPMYSSISPISQTSEMPLSPDPPQFEGSWKSPNPIADILLMSFFDRSPMPHNEAIPSYSDGPDDFSSSASTPFPNSTSLSPANSPDSTPPTELPLAEQSLSDSLLFSRPQAPSSQTSRRPRKVTSKRSTRLQPTLRLSSVLPLTSDSSIKPYACGREQCWPAGSATSSHCFSTSKELFDHSRDFHVDDLPGEKPFRCALEGCGKSWKSINGLQYHLQISTAHFRVALSSRFSAQTSSSAEEQPSTTTDMESENSGRVYTCPHADCFKAYRQASGLRYHLKHGHPQHMPAQLQEVPPALARQIPTKTKRMRQKSSADLRDPL